jgi:hypothetical protein
MSASAPHNPNANQSALAANSSAKAHPFALPEPTPETTPLSLVRKEPHSHQPLFPVKLDFTWKGAAFTVCVSDDENRKEALITLKSCTGWLPFSAENRSLRDLTLEFFNQHSTALTGEFDVRVGGQVNFTQKTRIPRPQSHDDIILALVICLLQAQPYFKTMQYTLQTTIQP